MSNPYITLTSKSNDLTVDIFVNQVFAVADSDSFGTLIISGQGGTFPVKEDRKKVRDLLSQNVKPTGGNTNE